MIFNNLLNRQIQKHIGAIDQLPENLLPFLNVVNNSFNQFEKDRIMLERSIVLSSAEMVELNERLKNELVNVQLQEKALEQSNADLCKLNLELDKFVYSISHDLRAPLKSILGVVSMTEEETDDDFTKDNMQLIKGSINKLDSFIVDLLDYSRNARTDIKKEDIDFKSIINDISENLKYMGENHRPVEFKFSINEQNKFCSDRIRINVVLNNLISNAIRYQNYESPQPFVNISVATTATEANIVIKDNGIGINPELHDKIFEMFYRVTENSVGSGLGLYLVKETVDKLKGEITVNSEPGVGTEFKLNIPNLYFQ